MQDNQNKTERPATPDGGSGQNTGATAGTPEKGIHNVARPKAKGAPSHTAAEILESDSWKPPARAKKKRRFHPAVLILLLLLFAGIFSVSLWQIITIQNNYRQARSEYDQLIPTFPSAPGSMSGTLPGTSSSLAEQPLTLEEVMALNSDCVGWIEIPDTALSYPVVRGGNNEKYLNTTFLGSYNPAGAIFMDWRNQPDFTSLHTIIYGHNMKDDSMFGSLKNYLKDDYLAQNPTIIIRTATTQYTYRIFSARVGDMWDDAYRIEFEDAAALSAFVSGYGGPQEIQRLLTLSTCTTGPKEERLLVMATLVGEAPL